MTLTDEQRQDRDPAAIQFTAYLPPIQSAVKIGGDGSVRIQLDVPATDMTRALRLLGLIGQAFTVTMEPEPPERRKFRA